MVVASIWSWVTRMVVTPVRRCSRRISLRIDSLSEASRLDSGSSSRSSCGALISARASATLLLAARELVGPPVEHALDLDQARGLGQAPGPLGGGLLEAQGKRMFWRTVMCG